ncbi:hypothetical protein Arub01_35520 [Actinomadura rubrobrunea]|uniref:Barstar (barnase inhibitor) domain-containing protein n=1 Tax=Actinomadura rubrobrunea TaxID=115335 RepID=A0A9W6PYH9_9ACTN|nr:barstar family protein [Actinomadura rubrobrunea]GLW65308.1 hypothetical protein Arub01_35520 [Actinomadura rubrobrunea]
MMSEGATLPLYQLVEEESGRVIIEAREIDGFFVDSDRDESRDVLIYGSAREPIRPDRDLLDVELRVVHSDGKVIGSYYIGRVGLRSEFEGEGGVGQGGGFVATFYCYASPYPAAGELWRRWAFGGPIREGEWAEHPVEAHRSWLHVVQNSWFEAGHSARRYGTEEVCVIDGRKIAAVSSFYCALGESVNGPGGYFGSNLDALADCLRQSAGTGTPFELIWEHFSVAQEKLGSRVAETLVSLLREFDVDVTLK